MTDCLDKELCGKLRDVVNSTNIFYEDAFEKKNYNSLCAMMDRVDESMDYILAHTDVPKTNDELLLVLNHISILTGAIKQLFDRLKLGYKEIEKDLPRHLQCICTKEPFNFSADQIPRDDTVFEYIRSISFAHPLDTNQGYLVRQIHDDHCSPFLMIDRVLCYKDHVGVYVYSNRSYDTFSIQFPYNILLAYAYERFKLIAYIIDALKQKIENKEKIWKARKVNRTNSPLEILEDILSIQEERYERPYEVRSLISILTCPCTLPENQESLDKVRQAVIDIIPPLCDATDDMDGELFYNVADTVIGVRPKQTYEIFFYHMEKIFSYLTDRANYMDKIWGLRQADEFSKEFAKKWVKIDVNTMEFEEIKVLVMVACYLETQEQNQGA